MKKFQKFNDGIVYIYEVVNASEKAFIAHWGKPGKQLGTRFVNEAEANVEAECAEAMQEKLYEYLDKKKS